MGKHRQRTSRGEGKTKKKKHSRTIWTGVEREVRRKDLDETAINCGTTAAEVAKAQKAEAATSSNPAESGTTTHNDDSVTASSSVVPKC